MDFLGWSRGELRGIFFGSGRYVRKMAQDYFVKTIAPPVPLPLPVTNMSTRSYALCDLWQLTVRSLIVNEQRVLCNNVTCLSLNLRLLWVALTEPCVIVWQQLQGVLPDCTPVQKVCCVQSVLYSYNWSDQSHYSACQCARPPILLWCRSQLGTLPTSGGSSRLKNKSRQLLSRVKLNLQIGVTVKQLKYVADSSVYSSYVELGKERQVFCLWHLIFQNCADIYLRDRLSAAHRAAVGTWNEFGRERETCIQVIENFRSPRPSVILIQFL